MTEDKIRELLREMRDEPMPADSLARVRAGLDARVQARTSRVWWKFAAAAAGVVVLGVGVWLQRPVKAPAAKDAPATVTAVQSPPVESRPAPVEVPVRRKPILRKAAYRKPKRPPVPAGTTIRIETLDPNVVIVLVGD